MPIFGWRSARLEELLHQMRVPEPRSRVMKVSSSQIDHRSPESLRPANDRARATMTCGCSPSRRFSTASGGGRPMIAMSRS